MEADKLRQLLSQVKPSKLLKDTHLSKQTFYNFKSGKNSNAQTLQKIESYLLKYQADCVLADLKFYGAPLAYKSPKKPSQDLHTTLLNGLVLAKTDALVESVLPYVFYKQRANFKPELLLRLAFKEGVEKLLGYHLDLCCEFKFVKKYNDVSNDLFTLFKHGHDNPETLNGEMVKEKYLPLYQENALALKWGLLLRGKVSHYMERFEKWAKLENLTSQK